MRTDISFMSCGLRCAGLLYVPDDSAAGQRLPAIVMAHGFSGVKEAYLPRFAEQFVAAGFVTLIFDYRYLGASEGEPRSQIIWHEQIEDYRNAITWVSEQPHVDPTRIGI
jgi:dipeptidyl aminopeptidase/acylaminoacyl peptidase